MSATASPALKALDQHRQAVCEGRRYRNRCGRCEANSGFTRHELRRRQVRVIVVGVRTGASFVRTGETGVVVDRLPPGQQCAETDDDVRALAVFLEAIEQAQTMSRESVRQRAAEEFSTCRIIDTIIEALANMGERIEAPLTL